MVEGARLESVYRGDSIVGSNPTVSASYHHKMLKNKSFFDRANRLHFRFQMAAFFRCWTLRSFLLETDAVFVNV